MPRVVMAFSFHGVRKARQEGKYGIAQERGLGKSGKVKNFNRITPKQGLGRLVEVF